MSKNAYKRQHTLPRVFLEGFTNENGLLVRYKKMENCFDKDLRSPKSVSRRDYAYSILTKGKKDHQIEHRFGKIETRFSPLIKKIRQSKLSELSEDKIIQIFLFCVMLQLRTEMTLDIANAVGQRANDLIKKEKYYQDLDNPEHMDLKELADKFIDNCQNNKNYAYAVALGALLENRVSNLLDNFDVIYGISNYAPLMVNDTYMCFEPLSTEMSILDNKNTDWGRLNIKVHLPISNYRCVSLIPKSDINVDDFKVKEHELTQADVNIINGLVVSQAKKYVYAAKKDTISQHV